MIISLWLRLDPHNRLIQSKCEWLEPQSHMPLQIDSSFELLVIFSHTLLLLIWFDLNSFSATRNHSAKENLDFLLLLLFNPYHKCISHISKIRFMFHFHAEQFFFLHSQSLHNKHVAGLRYDWNKYICLISSTPPRSFFVALCAFVCCCRCFFFWFVSCGIQSVSSLE